MKLRLPVDDLGPKSLSASGGTIRLQLPFIKLMSTDSTNSEREAEASTCCLCLCLCQRCLAGTFPPLPIQDVPAFNGALTSARQCTAQPCWSGAGRISVFLQQWALS